MSEIRLIDFREGLELRAKILKPHLSPDQCVNPGDHREGSFHLGAFVDDGRTLVGIASFEIENHPSFQAKFQYRLRGMATDLTHRGQGLGKQILLTGQTLIVERHGDFLWFNARMAAFPFYESLGFKFSGEFFELPQIGLHKVMYKSLAEPIN